MSYFSIIETIRKRPGFFGYFDFNFNYLLRNLMIDMAEKPQKFNILYHQDSLLLRSYGKNIIPEGVEFLYNINIFDKDFQLPDNESFLICLAWGKFFRLRTFNNGTAKEILCKQSLLQRQNTFPTNQADGWELYFKLDPEIRTAQIKNFTDYNWFSEIIYRYAAFYPQHSFKLMGQLIPGGLKHFTDKIHYMTPLKKVFVSEKFDCVIGYCPCGTAFEITSYVYGCRTRYGGTHEKYFTNLVKRIRKKEFPERKYMLRRLEAIINYKPSKNEDYFFSRSHWSELGSEIDIPPEDHLALENFLKECAEEFRVFSESGRGSHLRKYYSL
ncbi:MAG: hypothetical protein IJW31_03835 [Lentisphaeria bacterium]|nr:hypothetical protein [Lentisphaeria bacterium]